MKINAFLPARKGSQRVKNKNTRKFGDFKFGLMELKIRQLLKASKIEKIYLSTDDEDLLHFAKNLNDTKLILHKRKAGLCSSDTSTDALILHACELIQDGHILWTHCTSPFFTHKDYDEAISIYEQKLRQKYDSLMSVNKLLGFFWYEGKFLNANAHLKWNFTQNAKPLYEINSACFLAHSEIYKIYKDRIGKKVFLYETNKIAGFDIDYEEDFNIAELLLEKYPNLSDGGGD